MKRDQKNHKLGFNLACITTCLAALFVFSLSISAFGGETTTGNWKKLADSMVAEAMKPPTWNGPKSSPPPAKNKLVISIPCMQAAVGCQRPGDAFLEAAKVLGWKTMLIDPAGDPAKLQAAFKQAIAVKADGIFSPATTHKQVQNILPLVKAAGIKVICHQGDFDKPGPDSWDVTINVDESYRSPALAAWIAKHSNGKAKILMVNNSEFDDVVNGYEMFKKVLPKVCPDCEVSAEIDFSIVDVATTLPQRVKATLLANPEIDYIYGPYDFCTTYINMAVVQAGKKGKVITVSNDGNPQNLQAIKDGIQGASHAISYEWEGWNAADQMNRLFNGQPRWGADRPEGTQEWYGNENVGTRLFDKSNLPENLAEPWSGDVDFRAEYKKIWGVE